MKNHIFLCVYAMNQGTVGGSTLLAFETMQEADRYIQNWLEHSCGLECYRSEAEEYKLREKNGGELPGLAFACPTLESPSDLEQYNGFYDDGLGGALHLFVMVIHDEHSAARFRKDIIKAFELDKTLSEEADEMMEMLEVLEDSFRKTVDYHTAIHKIDMLLKNDGLSLF